MRAFRFSAQLGFAIEENTLRGCVESKSGLTHIARERIAAEFLRLLLSSDPTHALHCMQRASIFPYVTETYLPNPAHLDLMARAPQDEYARLALFLSETTKETATRILRNLKLSNKHVTAVGAILSCMRISVCSAADARRLIASCGVYAPLSVRLSVLLGCSPADAIRLVEGNHAPCTLSELAISGKDLTNAGIRGKDVGRILQALLDAVLEAPELNQADRLLALANDLHAKELKQLVKTNLVNRNGVQA